MKVITFSKTFPVYHPEKGNQTKFLEKIWSGLLQIDRELYVDYLTGEARPDYMSHYSAYEIFEPKYHTIRSGKRFKVGDQFSPRMWSAKPYASKQLIIAPSLTIKKTWSFEIKEHEVFLDGSRISGMDVSIIAQNDGLSFVNFMQWFNFPKPFNGQVICWNDKLDYEEIITQRDE